MKKTTATTAQELKAYEISVWIENYISNKGLIDEIEVNYTELGSLLEIIQRPESTIDGVMRCHAQILFNKICEKGRNEGNRKALELLKYSLHHGEYRSAVKYLHKIKGLHPSAIDAIERRIASL